MRKSRGLLVIALMGAVLGGCADAGRVARTIAHDSSPARVHPADSAKSFWRVVVESDLDKAANYFDEVFGGTPAKSGNKK